MLDPIANTGYSTRTFGYLVYETLVSRDSQGNYKPQMLESWQVSADSMTYTFKLRPGLKWHDGTPVRAQDCVASIQRWGKRDGLGGKLMAATASLSATDDETFVLKLAQPFGLVIEALGKESFNVPFMMPEKLASQDANKALTEVNGSGPFIFKADEFKPGTFAAFVKNANYVPRSEPPDGMAGGHVPKIDRVELRFIADSATQILALRNGEVDFVQYPSLDLLPTLRGNKDIKVDDPGPTAVNVGLIRLNHLQPPFDNPEIRRALAIALDRKVIVSALGSIPEFVDPNCIAFFGCTGPYATTRGGEELANPSAEKAKEILKNAGYKGEKILLLNMSGTAEIAGPVIGDQLKKAGFNVEVQLVEFTSLLQRRTSKATVAEGGWSGFITFLTSVDIESPLTHPYVNNTCNPNYPGWSCDQETQKLLADFAVEPDTAKRKEMANLINARSHINSAAIMWGRFTIPVAYRTSLKNFLSKVTGPVFWNVTKE